MKTIKQLQSEIEAKQAQIRAFCDQVGEREFAEDEQRKADSLVAEYEGLLSELERAREGKKRVEALRELGGGPVAAEQKAASAGAADILFQNEDFQRWLKGYQPASRNQGSPSIRVKTLITGSSSTSAGAMVVPDYKPYVETLGRAPLSILNLILRESTGSDEVHYVRQTAQVTQAAVTPESNVTKYTGGTGEVEGASPEGAMTFEEVTDSIKDITVNVPASRRAIADAGQLRGLIENDIRDDILEDLEYEMVTGAGGTSHFTGILSTSGVLSQEWTTYFLTTARKAVTAVRVTGRATPTAWLMNPEDKEMVDLLQDGDKKFYYGGPFSTNTSTLWGYPIVECDHVTQGTAILGDFRKAKWWDRQDATISISDGYEDFFTRRLVMIQGVMRAGFGVLRPSAFVLVETESST